MDQTNIGDPENNVRTVALIRAIADFLETIEEREDSKYAVDVKNGGELKGTKIGQKPERFLEEQFVRDCIEILDYPEYRPQPKDFPGLGDLVPDFQLVDDDYPIIGELKKPNEFQDSRLECKAYLEKIEVPAAGIATDGFTWALLLTEGNGNVTRKRTARIGKPVHQLGMECLYERGARRERRPLRKRVYRLVESFERQSVEQTIEEYLD